MRELRCGAINVHVGEICVDEAKGSTQFSIYQYIFSFGKDQFVSKDYDGVNDMA